MSIQSTQDITRSDAYDRIEYIDFLLRHQRYKEIVDNSFEPDYDVVRYARDYIPVDTQCITHWTDQMLEDQMDEPFFRLSLFDNYRIMGECE